VSRSAKGDRWDVCAEYGVEFGDVEEDGEEGDEEDEDEEEEGDDDDEEEE
jgi:hypothetical protein